MSTPEEQEEAREAENAAIRKRAEKLLDEKVPGTDGFCPFCGVSEWILGDLVNLPIGQGHPSKKVYVAVTTICSNCGYMQLFHARYLGALEDSPSDEESS